jgi:hypothetical protein
MDSRNCPYSVKQGHTRRLCDSMVGLAFFTNQKIKLVTLRISDCISTDFASHWYLPFVYRRSSSGSLAKFKAMR